MLGSSLAPPRSRRPRSSGRCPSSGHDQIFEHPAATAPRPSPLLRRRTPSALLLGFASIPTIPSSSTTERRLSASCYRRLIFRRCFPTGNPGFVRLERVCGIPGPALLQQGRARQHLERIRDRQHFRRKRSVARTTSEPITGTLSVHDADIGDALTAFVTGNATIEYNGSARAGQHRHIGVGGCRRT